jgi:hypothetical protein
LNIAENGKPAIHRSERLAPLPGTQVARVSSPVPDGCTISVEKVALFCNLASGTHSKAKQLRL